VTSIGVLLVLLTQMAAAAEVPPPAEASLSTETPRSEKAVGEILGEAKASDDPLAVERHLFREDVSEDGRKVRIPFPLGRLDAVKSLVARLGELGETLGVTIVVAETGNLPAVVLLGEPQAVATLRERVAFMLGEESRTPQVLVDVAVNLREMQSSDVNQAGVNLFPTMTKGEVGFSRSYATANDGSFRRTDTSASTGDLQLTIPEINLNQLASMGRVVVGTDVVTHNGVTAEITSEDHTPVIKSTSQGGIEAVDQSVVTAVLVTPVITRFDAENPARSLVKLTIEMTISFPLGTVKGKDGKTEAVAYSEKRLTTERIVRADGQQVFAGSFIQDALLTGSNRAPLLSSIPLLKYLFSNERKEKSRSASVLFISARLLPRTLR